MNHQRRQIMNRNMNPSASGVVPYAPGQAPSLATPSQASPPQGHALAVSGDGATVNVPRQPYEYIDEVVQILKTAFPLLVLSLETMVDQIAQRFKASSEEETYRLVGMLLLEATQVGITLLLVLV
jgi:transformation/transcription domain-associated protein